MMSLPGDQIYRDVLDVMQVATATFVLEILFLFSKLVHLGKEVHSLPSSNLHLADHLSTSAVTRI